MKNSYLIVVEADFVRDVQVATVPEADYESDDWTDVQGEFVLGVFEAESEEEAIGDAAHANHFAGDVLKAYLISSLSPKVAITLEGGLVQNVFSDTQLDYTIIDYTVDSHDSDDGRYTILPTGDAALAWTAKAQVLPDEFVRLGIPLDYVEED